MRGEGLGAAGPASSAARVAAAAMVPVAGFGAIGAAVAGGPGALAGVVCAGVLLAAGCAYGDRLALSAMLARPVGEVEHPELYRLVRELSKTGRLPVPRLYLSPAEQPNAFTVGRGPRTASVCCTRGLLGRLDEAELRGVLGHELAHLSGRDLLAATVSAGLATIITFPAGLARFLPGRAGSAAPGSAAPGSPAPRRPGRSDHSGLGPVEASLLLVLGPVAALVIRLAVSRAREYRADAAGASLSGDPVALANALRKVDAGTAELALAPDGRLTSVGHLMIACPFRAEGFARLFRTHPPAGERVRRLEALAGYRR